jgi:DNA-binding phage protein
LGKKQIPPSNTDDAKASLEQLRRMIIAIGQRKVARKSGISRRTLERFLRNKNARTAVVAKIIRALQIPER